VESKNFYFLEIRFIYYHYLRSYTCTGGQATGGWCGPGMSFDPDNQRCEMALAINCKDGERPDWKAPDGCMLYL
jgi:hypothetical protein